MNPAEILLVLLALAGSGWAALRFFHLTRNEREQRRRERQGMRNADAERRERGEICVICSERVVPAQDVFDRATATWWHRRCWQEHLK